MRVNVFCVIGWPRVVEVMDSLLNTRFFGVETVERLAVVRVVPAIASFYALRPSGRRRRVVSAQHRAHSGSRLV